uniref:Probable glucan 1,3-beta-glucosidase A n=1 Tax=Tanacetum cinerariifolium TaxID=118510 RepID=A0A6L2NRA5_TANCI|nr:probable glucan 1,3-beta-glucosidase A [Tanacetum cinerariifolium]
MRTRRSKKQLLCIVCVFALFFISNGRTLLQSTNNQMIKAVNLGGWLDGAQLRLKSVTIGKYLAAELGGGTIILWRINETSFHIRVFNKQFLGLDSMGINLVATSTDSEKSGIFEIIRKSDDPSRVRIKAPNGLFLQLWRVNETSFHIRVFNKQFLGLDSMGINLVATSTDSEKSGIFEIIRKSDDPSRVRIKAPNGLFLQAKTENLVTADSKGDGQWGNNDPSVFEMSIAQRFYGEFQVTNGHGPLKAPQIMKDHWETFIVEKDFKFIAESGLNAVRIPVGWWTASDPSPPKPFVGGSLQYLDKAFVWAKQYNLKVILDLHAASGSQNGFEHSATRDGFIEWGLTEENIQETVRVIEFFTARYAANPSLYAVELINEPLASGVPVSVLNKYYDAGYKAVRKYAANPSLYAVELINEPLASGVPYYDAGYKAVRKYAPNAFVILATRLSGDAKEFFPLAKGMQKVVIDVHYYNLFSDIFNDMTVEQNINFIQTNRSNELQDITTSDGPLTFVGEWVAEWQVSGASKEDYQRFSKAQLDVFGRASFGWAYWSLKNVNDHWSIEWMIKNDGTTLQFKSMASGRYPSAEHGGGSIIVANRNSAKSWETFKGRFGLKDIVIDVEDADTTIVKETPFKIPIWIRLSNIPLEAWNVKGIITIASMLGRPINMDKMTAMMCKDGSGRLGFARVLVETNAEKECIDNIEINYVDDLNNVKKTKWVKAEYSWKPDRCNNCCVFGHYTQHCKLKPRAVEVPKGAVKQNNQADKEGFVKVSSRKNVGGQRDMGNKGIPKAKQSFMKDMGPRNNSVKFTYKHIVPDHTTANKEKWAAMERMENENSDEDDVFESQNQAVSSLSADEVVVNGNDRDFNVTLKLKEHYSGSSVMTSDIGEFKDVINSLEIEDLCSTAFHFTWIKSLKNPQNSILKKLDRIMMNDDFLEQYGQAHGMFLPFMVSDHSPSMLIIPSIIAKKKKSFRFATYVADKPNFLDTVKGIWDKQIKGCVMYKSAVKADPFNKNKKEVAALLFEEYSIADEDEIKLLHQKVKIKWLSEGDRNTAYFYIVLKARKHKVGWNLSAGRMEAEDMVREVFDEEIKSALSDINSSKAAGLDGYFKGGMGLRQDLISPYLFTLVMEVFNMIMIKNVNEADKFKYHYGCSEPKLTHMCFANNLMVMCNGDTDSLRVVKKSLDEFSRVSGLYPNLNKSTIFFGCILENNTLEML